MGTYHSMGYDKKDEKKKYGNRDFFGKNISDIPISNIKTYLGDDRCNLSTKSGQNCARSFIYEKDNKKLNCTKYCIDNQDKWKKYLFDYPKYANFTELYGYVKNTEKVIGAIYQFIKEDKQLDIAINLNGKCISIVTQNQREIKYDQFGLDYYIDRLDLNKYNIINVSLIIDNHGNDMLDYTYNSVYTFDSFSNKYASPDRLLQSHKYWSGNPLSISINLKNGDILKDKKFISPYFKYSKIFFFS